MQILAVTEICKVVNALPLENSCPFENNTWFGGGYCLICIIIVAGSSPGALLDVGRGLHGLQSSATGGLLWGQLCHWVRTSCKAIIKGRIIIHGNMSVSPMGNHVKRCYNRLVTYRDSLS